VPDASVIAPEAWLVVDTGPGGALELQGVARSSWTDRVGRTMVGFEFLAGQYPTRARLALALFGARATESRRVAAAKRATARPVGDEAIKPDRRRKSGGQGPVEKSAASAA